MSNVMGRTHVKILTLMGFNYSNIMSNVMA
jgi:hypothetical protein